MSERDSNEIREWLVKIDQNQKHQTELLNLIKETSDKALVKADNAEDIAEEALLRTERNERDLSEHIAEEKVERRWIIGLIVTSALTLLPIVANFYL